MATIVTRAGKGSPLTNTEVDANFTNLNNDKLEKNNAQYLDFDTAAGYTVGVGQVAWNADAGTIDIGMSGGNVTLQVGQEELVRIFNNSGSAMADMQVVRITGSQGNSLTAALAQANTETSSATSLAVVTEPILNATHGFATRGGVVRNVNTSAFTEGAALWLSPTVEGGITATKPAAPDHMVLIGWCVRSHATVGSIFVHVQNGYELDELHDVLITSKASGDSLWYNSSIGVWENLTPANAKVKLSLNNVENKSSVTIRSEITSSNVTTALGFTPENAANKGQANGYTPLDSNGKVASTYLPSYVDDVLEYANTSAFPLTGESGKIYVDISTGKTYRWSGSTYSEISASPGSTDAVSEGTSNLYFTYQRVRDTVLTGLSTATNAVISATDTVIAGFGKLQAQVSAISSSLTSHTSNTSNPHSTTAAQVGAIAKTSATGSAILSSGTTAQRDSSPVGGYFRFNSEVPQYEGYINGGWQPFGVGLPAQTSQNGKFLTTDGTNASWSLVSLTSNISGTLPIANGGTNATDAATARSNLGLVIGTNVQAYDAGLLSIAGLTTSADRMIYTTAADTYAVATLTATARSLLDDADTSTMRSTLGVSIGSNVQAWDADLDAIAALTGTVGLLKKTAANTWTLDTTAYTTNTGTVTSVGITVPTGLTASGSPITTSGTLALSFTAGYSIPTTSSQTNWDSAYSQRLQWDGGNTNLVASTGRTSLGATTLGSNLFTVTNPTAVTFLRVNADNTVSTLDAAAFRTAIGAGTSSTTGTVTSVGGTGSVSGLTLTGTVTSSGNLTLGGTLTVAASNFASQTAKYALIAPNTADGTPTFRFITLEDLTDAWTKRSCRVATTANITLSAPQTIDGISVIAGDRVLVKDQTTASQNGIYVVNAAAWTRALDADTASEIAGAVVNVDSGTVNGGFRFDTDFKTTDTINTTAMTWYKCYDASDASTANTVNKLVLRDASGNFSAGTITAALFGNANTATTLQTARAINGTSFNGSADITTANWGTARTIAFNGDLSGSSSVNGSANVTTSLTLATVNSNVGTFGSATAVPVFTVNAKGLVTGVTATTINADPAGSAIAMSIALG